METLKVIGIILGIAALFIVVWIGVPLLAGWVVYFYGAPKYFAITVGIVVLLAMYLHHGIRNAAK